MRIGHMITFFYIIFSLCAIAVIAWFNRDIIAISGWFIAFFGWSGVAILEYKYERLPQSRLKEER